GNSTPDDMIQVLVGLISNGVEGASGGKVLSTQLGGSNSILLPGLNQVLNHMPDDNGIAHPPPQAYLNWMLFDEQFNLVGESSGYDRVSGYDTAIRALTGDVDIVKNGYLFVYVSNETPSKDVFFDNLAISHTSGPLMEETHYYPFGLVMSGISSKAASTLENRYKYNGKELQNHEFSDGSGLELYDFGARDQDPQIGRWWTIDPLANKKIWLSPYNFCSNNPINNIDPNGLTDFAINKKTGEVKQVGEKNDDPDRLLKTNRRGIVKTGKSGPKVAIDNIEKGILKDGMNFKKNDNLIAVGQQGQPSVNGVQSFTLQLSNYVGVEIGGALLSKDKSSQTDFVALGYFKDNTITSTKSNGQGVWGSNKVTEMFHTHTNASSEEKIIPSQSDRRTRDGNLEIKPNMKFTIITEPTRSDDPYPKKIDFSSVTEYPTD
ncbi:MAG TPA: RHS repeat-associated core domain-containing protein, partial [Ferruginibacter sp.]|nr:RHS repeat-associated core domain-containing protein [Ferruginibacter sp.]